METYYRPGFYVKHYLKEILILKVFSFEDKDPSFTQAKTVLVKPGLALRLVSQGLFNGRAMDLPKELKELGIGYATNSLVNTTSSADIGVLEFIERITGPVFISVFYCCFYLGWSC